MKGEKDEGKMAQCVVDIKWPVDGYHALLSPCGRAVVDWVAEATGDFFLSSGCLLGQRQLGTSRDEYLTRSVGLLLDVTIASQ